MTFININNSYGEDCADFKKNRQYHAPPGCRHSLTCAWKKQGFKCASKNGVIYPNTCSGMLNGTIGCE